MAVAGNEPRNALVIGPEQGHARFAILYDPFPERERAHGDPPRPQRLRCRVGAAAGIVGPTATMPVLSHMLLTARDGRLDLAATNLDLWLTSSCDAAGDGGIAVPGRKLMEIVRALAGDEVRLVLDEPGWLTIIAGPARFKIQGKPPGEFPSLPEVPWAATATAATCASSCRCGFSPARTPRSALSRPLPPRRLLYRRSPRLGAPQMLVEPPHDLDECVRFVRAADWRNASIVCPARNSPYNVNDGHSRPTERRHVGRHRAAARPAWQYCHIRLGFDAVCAGPVICHFRCAAWDLPRRTLALMR